MKTRSGPAATTLAYRDRRVTLVCHMAVLSGMRRQNSAEAIAECFEADASRVEIDIHSLDGPDYAVFHERRLEEETDGKGAVGRATPDDIRRLRYIDAPSARPPLLSEIVAMAEGCDSELQLDLKDWRPMPDERIAALLACIAPIKNRVIVSCGQDWNLRRLRDADPALALGFDPGFYFDRAIEGTDIFVPRAMGAYGYRDDHPLALGRIAPTPEYLAERMSILAGHVADLQEFFLDHRLILQMLDDGFNAVDWLHARGIDVTAWTPDYRGPRSLVTFTRLVEAGVDRITTNTIPAWLDAFASGEESSA